MTMAQKLLRGLSTAAAGPNNVKPYLERCGKA
jgi:hypothetical protein